MIIVVEEPDVLKIIQDHIRSKLSESDAPKLGEARIVHLDGVDEIAVEVEIK